MENGKKNNCWLSIYVLRTDRVETHSLVKLFFFYRVPLTDAHTLWITSCGNLRRRSHFYAPGQSCPPWLATCVYPAGSKSFRHEEEGQPQSRDGPRGLEGAPVLGAQLLWRVTENSLSCEHQQALVHTQTCRQRISLYKYFLTDPTMMLKMEFYFPFFVVNFFIYYALEETSLSNYFIICYTKKYICEWLHYFSS